MLTRRKLITISVVIVTGLAILLPGTAFTVPTEKEVTDALAPPPAQEMEKSVPSSTGDVSLGRDIFTGRVRLQNGGPACMSCHNISGIGTLGGGTMAKDLTAAYATFGEQGLFSVLKTTPFPVMTEIFAEQPLTDEEATYLVAFMQEAGNQKTAQNPAFFIGMSVVGLVVLAGILQLTWRRRLSGVRQPLVKGDSK